MPPAVASACVPLPAKPASLRPCPCRLAQEAVSVVERRPSIMGVDVPNLQRMVGFLLESGSSREQVVELLSTSL